MIINSWPFNLCLYLISIILFNQFYKLAISSIQRDGAATILLQIIGGVSILILIPFFSFPLPKTLTAYIFLVVASVFYAINDRLQTTARKNLQVSIITIVNQTQTIFLLMYGFTLLRSPIN